MGRREIAAGGIARKQARATSIGVETAVAQETEAETVVGQAGTVAEAPGEEETGSAIAVFPIRVPEATLWVDQVAAQRERAVRADPPA